MTRSTHTLTLDQGTLDVTVDLFGQEGHPFLLLHGGGGPGTVAPFAACWPSSVRPGCSPPSTPGSTALPAPSG